MDSILNIPAKKKLHYVSSGKPEGQEWKGKSAATALPVLPIFIYVTTDFTMVSIV